MVISPQGRSCPRPDLRESPDSVVLTFGVLAFAAGAVGAASLCVCVRACVGGRCARDLLLELGRRPKRISRKLRTRSQWAAANVARTRQQRDGDPSTLTHRDVAVQTNFFLFFRAIRTSRRGYRSVRARNDGRRAVVSVGFTFVRWNAHGGDGQDDILFYPSRRWTHDKNPKLYYNVYAHTYKRGRAFAHNGSFVTGANNAEDARKIKQ